MQQTVQDLLLLKKNSFSQAARLPTVSRKILEMLQLKNMKIRVQAQIIRFAIRCRPLVARNTPWFLRTAVAALSVILFSSIALATSFTNIVVFGDSLSDNGNAAYIFKNLPQFIPAGLPAPEPPLYTSGRYTNGPDVTPTTAYQGTWVEQLAAKLKVSDPQPGLPNFLDPSLPAGTNLAVAGAQTGGASPVSVSAIVGDYLSIQPGSLSPNTLYVLFGGANDLLQAGDPVAAAKAAVDNIFTDVALLHAAGAENFLVPNLPDLGATPRAAQQGDSAALHAASLQYDVSWQAALAAANNADLNVTGVDLYSLFQQLETNPAAFGLANVTTPAQGQAVDPDTYLFWDVLHPTTAGHSFIADAAFNALTVPEPASPLLPVCVSILFIYGCRKTRLAFRQK
jgi:outer membrane lipase/esterase